MVVNKYLAGLLSVALISLTALQASVADGFTVTEAWQLAGLVLGAFVTTLVPLLKNKWAAGLKVGGAVLGAAVAALVPFVTSGWDAAALSTIVLAVLNTLAVQLGVSVRVDSAKQAIADTTTSNAVPVKVDPAAVVASGNSEIIEGVI